MPQSLQTIRQGSLSRLANAQEAQAFLQEGCYEAALQSFHQADASGSLSVDDYVSQAVCLLHLDQFQTALEVCDRVLATDSNHAKAWLFRGVACQRLGHWRDAYVCYDRATGQQSHRQTAFARSMWRVLRGLKSSIKGIFNNRQSHLRVH